MKDSTANTSTFYSIRRISTDKNVFHPIKLFFVFVSEKIPRNFSATNSNLFPKKVFRKHDLWQQRKKNFSQKKINQFSSNFFDLFSIANCLIMIKNLTKINRSVTIDSKKCISGLFITMKIFIRFTQNWKNENES